MTQTIFTDERRPEVRKDGKLRLPPGNVLHNGQLDVKLTPREWLYLFFCETRNMPEGFLFRMVGSQATITRVRQSLRRKGYL